MTVPSVPEVPLVPPVRSEGVSKTAWRLAVEAFHKALAPFSVGLNATIAAINALAATITGQANAAAADRAATQVLFNGVEELYEGLIANNLGVLIGNSTTSTTIGTGAKSFAATAGKLWRADLWVMIYSAANPTNWMAGPVTSYDMSDGNPLAVDVRTKNGAGTFTDWVICPTMPSVSRTVPELIGTLPTTSGTTWTFDPLPTGYADLFVEIAGISHNGGSNNDLTCEIYDGVSWVAASGFSLAQNRTAANVTTAAGLIFGYQRKSALTLVGGASPSSIATTDGIKGIRWRWSSGAAGDAGAINVWGR